MARFKQSPALWLGCALACWALAAVFAASDNLTEFAPILLLLGGGALGGWQWTRSRASAGPTSPLPAPPVSGLSWTARILDILGLAGVVLSVLGLAVPALRELAPLGFLGLFLLALAALVRVGERMRAREVSATGGAVRIAAGAMPLAGVVVAGLALTVVLYLLKGLGLA